MSTGTLSQQPLLTTFCPATRCCNIASFPFSGPRSGEQGERSTDRIAAERIITERIAPECIAAERIMFEFEFKLGGTGKNSRSLKKGPHLTIAGPVVTGVTACALGGATKSPKDIPLNRA